MLAHEEDENDDEAWLHKMVNYAYDDCAEDGICDGEEDDEAGLLRVNPSHVQTRTNRDM